MVDPHVSKIAQPLERAVHWNHRSCTSAVELYMLHSVSVCPSMLVVALVLSKGNEPTPTSVVGAVQSSFGGPASIACGCAPPGRGAPAALGNGDLASGRICRGEVLGLPEDPVRSAEAIVHEEPAPRQATATRSLRGGIMAGRCSAQGCHTTTAVLVTLNWFAGTGQPGSSTVVSR